MTMHHILQDNHMFGKWLVTVAVELQWSKKCISKLNAIQFYTSTETIASAIIHYLTLYQQHCPTTKNKIKTCSSYNWNKTQEVHVSQKFKLVKLCVLYNTEKHYQCCAYKVGKPYGYPDGAPAPFQPHVLEKADKHWCNWNTESRGNSSHSDRERVFVHPQQSHGAAPSLHGGPCRLLCVALFPFSFTPELHNW